MATNLCCARLLRRWTGLGFHCDSIRTARCNSEHERNMRSKRNILGKMAVWCSLFCVIVPSPALSYDPPSDSFPEFNEGQGTVSVLQSLFTAPSDKGPIVGPEEIILPTDKKPYSWPDGKMGIIKSGSSYNFFAAADGYPKRTIGTLDSPQAQGVTDLKIEHLKSSYPYAAGGAIYEDPLTGTLLMIYHAERWIAPDSYLPFYSELGMAQSMDGGNIWTDLGPIITPHAPFTSEYFQLRRQTFDVGGGGYLIIGEYFYVYFNDLLEDGKNYTVLNFAVARARVSDVVDAAINRGKAAVWTKYFDGTWTEPGIGGRSTSLAPGNHDVLWGDVSYNSYLNKYISIAAGAPWPATDLYWAESEDGLHWTNYCRIVSDPMHKYYVTVVGLGDNPRETGGKFYIYYIRSRLYAQGGNRNEDAVLARRLIAHTDGAKICP